MAASFVMLLWLQARHSVRTLYGMLLRMEGQFLKLVIIKIGDNKNGKYE